MRTTAFSTVLLTALLLVWCPFALAQEPGLEVPLPIPGPGWKVCPRCENPAHVADDRLKYKVEGHPFKPRDLSGVWLSTIHIKNKIEFTPYGRKLAEADKSELGPGGVEIPGSKDPRLICDPVGWPRAAGADYGMEFFIAPSRVFQFFEWSHTWRTIWTDGRKLPSDPPVQRFLGYSVGRWDGDTFVVESSGFDDRSWITISTSGEVHLEQPDGLKGEHGLPHSIEMKVTERYKRLNYGELELSMTITDPKVYAQPLNLETKYDLRPGAEIGEYFCVPSESLRFDAHSAASAGAASSPYGKEH